MNEKTHTAYPHGPTVITKHHMSENEKAGLIAGFGGLLMLGFGVTGATQWQHSIALLIEIVGENPYLRFIGFVFAALGSLGGVFVILGAYAFRYDSVRAGKLMIMVGTGFTVFSLFLFLIVSYRTHQWPFVGLSMLGFFGILLTIVARFKSKPIPLHL